MRTLYIECKMGAAGDMLMAALYELLTEEQRTLFLDKMNGMFAPDIRLLPETKKAAGISGTHMRVEIMGQALEESDQCHGHSHHSYPSILAHIGELPLEEEVRQNALSVYRLIGEAEAKVHDVSLEQIHFHEVGSLDALADVVGVCLLIHLLAPECILASPIHVGNGMVHCAHGILPVPAPATAELLRGLPFYTGSVEVELCTPTGTALLKHFVRTFGSMPAITLTACGIGHGTKELPCLNAVRTFLGESEGTDAHPQSGESDRVLDISCNMDDMTGEALGFAMEVLFRAGALDVFYVPVQMKKNRPGILLHCFCTPEEKERFALLILKHTTTRGVRFAYFDRKKLTSRYETTDSAYGPVTRKISEGFGVTKAKYEFEDKKRLADEHGIALASLGLDDSV